MPIIEQQDRYFPGGGQNSARVSKRFVRGLHPPIIEHAKGARLIDEHGREWIDFHLGFGAVILGHGNEAVVEACRHQALDGPVLSCPSMLELDVAKLLLQDRPWHQQVRFVKTGADACSAAVRIARAVTGRDYIITSGYHGWHDWANPSRGMAGGVPHAVAELSIETQSSDFDELLALVEARGSTAACVIIDAACVTEFDQLRLETLRERCTALGLLLIFDEVVTGFRVTGGSLAACTGVIPDLSCYAKAMGNGYPIGAITGSEELMSHTVSVGLTGTYFPDALAMTAARATLQQLGRTVEQSIESLGQHLKRRVEFSISDEGLSDFLCLSGIPQAMNLSFCDGQVFIGSDAYQIIANAMADHGVFWQGVYVLCAKHNKADADKLARAFTDGFKLICHARRRSGDDSLAKQVRP